MFNFCPNYTLSLVGGCRWHTYTDKLNPYDINPMKSVDDVIRWLDMVNSEADMENRTIPYEEATIVEVDVNNMIFGSFKQSYQYEPYTAAERRAFNERPLRGPL